MVTTRLNSVQFDLAYLALLTENGTMPLSRWEGLVPGGIEDVMKDIGLEFAYVCRRLRNGKSTTELIFSKSEAGLSVPSGVYLVHLQVGTETRVQKVAVVR